MATIGPDAARYIAAARGVPVPRPFHLRPLLPWLCGDNMRRWWTVYLVSWPLAAVGMFGFAAQAEGWRVAVVATVLLLGLPGILGPSVSVPVQVDLPSSALGLCSAALIVTGHPAQIAAGCLLLGVAALIRESTPVWVALWCWSLWPLVVLAVPLTVYLIRRPGPDPLGPAFQRIADHPIRTAFEHRRGHWRNGLVWLLPWGACLAALVGIDWRLGVVLAVAHLQLLVATDMVRLVQHAAGPPMAVAAALVIPPAWWVPALAVHLFWLVRPSRI